MTEDQCIEFCKKYFDESFYPELESTVAKAYYNSFYRYRYTLIAKLLEFTDEDIKESYSCFSEERKAEAKKKKSRIQCEKRKQKNADFKSDRYEYIKENINEPVKMLAFACNCSARTINRIKAEIRKGS